MSTSAAPATPAQRTFHLPNVEDYEQTLRRYDAWWDQQVLDRAPVVIPVHPAQPISYPERTYPDQRSRWFDLEARLDDHARMVAGSRYLGDTLPSFMPNLGPEVLATLYGADLEFTATTSWSNPIAHACRELFGRQPDLTGAYWSWIRRATDLSLELGRDRWITAITDLHASGDLVAALREPQSLLVEFADDLEAVEQLMQQVTPVFAQCYDDTAPKLLAAGQPTVSWLPAPCRTRGCVLQCDLICMISPKAFQRVILPALRAEMRHLDRCIFHLDGPGALRHLDALLACDELDAIQWVYGSGNGPASKWIPVYQKIQAAGKSMEIILESLADAEPIMQALKPQGVLFDCYFGSDEVSVRAFLKRVAAWR